MAEGATVIIRKYWPEARAKIQSDHGPTVLRGVALFLGKEFQDRVENIDVVDTGFYHDSVYVSGQGLSTFRRVRDTGKYFGYNHTYRTWKRERAEENRTAKKNSIIVGVAASYATILEKGYGAFMFALQKTKTHYGGSLRMRVDEKELTSV